MAYRNHVVTGNRGGAERAAREWACEIGWPTVIIRRPGELDPDEGVIWLPMTRTVTFPVRLMRRCRLLLYFTPAGKSLIDLRPFRYQLWVKHQRQIRIHVEFLETGRVEPENGIGSFLKEWRPRRLGVTGHADCDYDTVLGYLRVGWKDLLRRKLLS